MQRHSAHHHQRPPLRPRLAPPAGAGDDASNVATMLEIAANMVAGEQLPPTPVLFFFSGGEEPLCQVCGASRPRPGCASGEAD